MSIALFQPGHFVRIKLQPSVYDGQMYYARYEVQYDLPDGLFSPMLGRNARGIIWKLDTDLNIVPGSIGIF